MDLSHNIDAWVIAAILAIAGAGKIVQALTALAQQVKTLFETLKSIDVRVTNHDTALTQIASAMPTASAVTITTGAGVTPGSTGDASNATNQ